MAALDEDGEYLWRCSGTLISPRIFLTAGHCTAPDPYYGTPASAQIWFDTGPIDVDKNYVDPDPPDSGDGCSDPSVKGYPCIGDVGGTPYYHPDYLDYPWFMHDLGVVVLDKKVKMGEYGALPELGLLDEIAAEYNKPDILFTAVGYGLQKSFPTAAAWKDQAIRIRMLAYPHLLQINTPGFTGDFSVLLSNNTSTGGTCFGDSGGPNFIWMDGEETNIVAGVTSFGMNPTCAGTGGVYRVDTADDLDWLFEEFGEYLVEKGKKK
jgi:hypothetical protein